MTSAYKTGPSSERDDQHVIDWVDLLQCPRCGGARLGQDDDAMLRCHGCGAAYGSVGTAPDLLGDSGDGQEIEEDYSHDERRRGGRLYRAYNDLRRSLEVQLLATESGRLGRPLDVVDVGSGDPTRKSGYHARIRRLSRRYLGIEPSLPTVSAIGACPGVGVVRASGEMPVLGEAVADVALCFSALDHCADPDRVLANMARSLRWGGCALIDLKNGAAWFRPVYDRLPRRLARRLAPHEHRHPFEFGPRELQGRLEAAGFREIALYDCFYAASLLRTRRLDGIARLGGPERWRVVLGAIDRVGHVLAPGRGGLIIALARK